MVDRSHYPGASSSKSSFLAPSRHELPRWRSRSPMAASMIPPPIVQSTFASPSEPAARSVLAEMPNPLQDRQSELETDLQYLLDAQAEGLVIGLEGGRQDDATSTGSTTPTARSVRSASGRRVARPARRRPGLRSARKGLYHTMLALSAVKDEELRDISDHLDEKDERLGRIDAWERKKAGLQDAAKDVDANEETVRVQRLREQAETVEAEIRELERQLEDRKVLRRRLMREVTAAENEVRAKMASYTNSIRMLEEDVRRFLSITPQQNPTEMANGDGQQSVWQLPPKRRTLELAREHFTQERESVLHRRQNVEHEKSALEEGAVVWKDVVTAVTDFERRMRNDMRVQTQNGQSQDDATSRLKDLLRHMDDVIQKLDAQLELAHERRWNLLIAAIGAELDALRRGQELLGNVLGVEQPRAKEDLLETQDSSSSAGERGAGRGEEMQGQDRSFEPARRRRASDGVKDAASEDDPDPELLFSTRDIDTE